MNHNQSQKMKRIVSGLLSLTMITSMSTILPANAETVSSLALDGLAVNNYGYTNVEGIVSDDVVTDIEGAGITIKGDVNSDGKITDDDRELLNKWLTRLIGKNDLDLKNADVNYDGKVNTQDLVELSRLCKKTTSEQSIDEGSEALSAINTEDNAFKLSVDISAAGDAETLLSADESGYSNAIKSDMVVGVVPELEYEEGYAVDEVTLNFDIKNELTDDGKYASVSDDFKGVRKFNVFKYFEDIDMLLPIETNYTEDNTITTTVDELGTYCLVDMEKWFETLGIKPEELANANTAPSSVSMVGTSETTAVESRSANTVGTAGIPVDQPIINSVASTAVTEPGPLDVIIQVYVKGTSIGLRNAQNDVLNTANKLFDEYGENGTLRVYVANYNGTLGIVNKKNYATSKEEAEVLANNLPNCTTTETPNFFDCVTSLVENYNNLDSKRPDTDTYHVFVDRSGIDTNDSHGKAQSFIENTIKKVFVTNDPYNKALADYIDGYYRESASGYGDDVSKYIIDTHGTGNKGDDDKFDYPIITATGWKRIELDDKIKPDYEVISERIRLGEDPREMYTSDYADTDKDGLLDLEEIQYLVKDKIFGKDIRVTWDKKGNVVLPTLAQVMQMKSGLSYIEEGIKELPLEYFGDFRILPIKSNPMDKDTDGDLVNDLLDTDPLWSYLNKRIWKKTDEKFSSPVQTELLKLEYLWHLTTSDIEKRELSERADEIRKIMSTGIGAVVDIGKTATGAAADEFAWLLGGDVGIAERDYWLSEVNKYNSKIEIDNEKIFHGIMFIAALLEPSPDDAWNLISKKATKEMMETCDEKVINKFLKSMGKYASKRGENGIKKLSGSGIKGYKYEVKIIGKGGAYRLLGNRTNSGEIFWEVFEKTHK